MGFPNNSLYTAKLSGDIARILQSGIVDKIIDEVRWEIQRSPTGRLLAVSFLNHNCWYRYITRVGRQSSSSTNHLKVTIPFKMLVAIF